jgi:hypothetical protein
MFLYATALQFIINYDEHSQASSSALKPYHTEPVIHKQAIHSVHVLSCYI